MIVVALALVIATTDSAGGRPVRPHAASVPSRAHRDSVAARDPWFGRDKLLHFTASAVIQGVTHAVLRANGRDYGAASRGAALVTATAGIGKELWDRHQRRDFSWRDLTWDGIGGVTGAVVMRQAAR